jgi:hypothetical protein
MEARKALPKGTLNLVPVPYQILYIGNRLGTGNFGREKARKNASFWLEKAGMPLEMPEQASNRTKTEDFDTFGAKMCSKKGDHCWSSWTTEQHEVDKDVFVWYLKRYCYLCTLKEWV